MNTGARIHWGRALVGGFLAEVAIVACMPVFLMFGERAPLYGIPPACLAMTFVFAVWVGRRIESRFLLHGLLVGVVSALLYLGMTWGQTLPLAYTISHGLKIVGGLGGGLVAAHRSRKATAPAVHAVTA